MRGIALFFVIPWLGIFCYSLVRPLNSFPSCFSDSPLLPRSVSMEFPRSSSPRNIGAHVLSRMLIKHLTPRYLLELLVSFNPGTLRCSLSFRTAWLTSGLETAWRGATGEPSRLLWVTVLVPLPCLWSWWCLLEPVPWLPVKEEPEG